MIQHLLSLDHQILDFLSKGARSDLLDLTMPEITILGNFGVIWVIAAVILLFIKNHRKHGLCLMVALALCTAVILSLKPLVGRIRPCDIMPVAELLIPHPSGYSFPSGHTLTAFCSAVVLYAANRKIGGIAFLLAALIGFSRIYLYVHYPSDVLGGIMIGSLLGVLCVEFFNKNIRTNI